MSSLDHLNRHPERGRTDRAALDALLDSQIVGTLATVVDGAPWVVPMLYARDGDRLLVHGSTGAGALRHIAAGAPVSLCVMAVDAIVVGHTTFSSSANYRSAVIRGSATALTGDAKVIALDLISDHVIPGRPAEVRPMSTRELAATIALELPIVDGWWLYKTRDAQASEPDEDTTAWTGLIPLTSRYGEPVASPWAGDAPVPESVLRLCTH